MPQPEGAALHHNYNPIITQQAQGMLQGLTTQFIARNVFPNVPVGSPSGMFTKWNRGDFMRRTAKRLANYEAPPIGGFGTGEGSFSVDTYGLATMWTRKDLANAVRGGVSVGNFEKAKTLYVVTGNLLELEIQTASLIQTTGSWTTTWAGVAAAPSTDQFIKWSSASSDPVDDMDRIKKLFRDTVGFNPNTVILPENIKMALRKNANLIDRIKYAGSPERPTQVTMEQIKGLWEMDRILTPEGRYNAAKEGAADNLQPIWSDTVWVGYTTPTPSPEQPSAGYHFSWTGDTTMGLPTGVDPSEGPQNWDAVRNDDGIFMRRYRENRPNATFLEGEMFTTPNVVAKDLGMTLTAVL